MNRLIYTLLFCSSVSVLCAQSGVDSTQVKRKILNLQHYTTDFDLKLPSSISLTNFKSDRLIFLTNSQNIAPAINVDQQGNFASPFRESFLLGTSNQSSFKWNNKVIKTTYQFDINGVMRSSTTSFKLGN